MYLLKKLRPIALSVLFLSAFSIQAQEDTLRIMQYNVLQLTSNSSSYSRVDNHLKQIIQYAQPDIILVNEVINSTAANYILTNALNVDGITHYDKGNFNNASSLNNAMFYNSEKLTFVSQDAIAASPRPADGYRFYYNDPNLSFHQDTVFLHTYVVHLKAGSSSSNANQRKNAAIAIRNVLDAKANTDNHFIVGDLNVYNSSEAAYQTLLGAGNCQFFDPISTPGIWHATAAFAPIHTQSTNTPAAGGAGGGMDDRFDFILSTNDVIQGSNRIKYVSNTYKALGNDGNRFNKALQSAPANTQYPADLVDDLYRMSDHIPVIADFSIDLPAGPVAGVGPCADLFFSEYIEGASANRALELYNPTSSTIQLNNYELHFYPDGTTTLPPYRRVALSGSILAESTFILGAPNAASGISAITNLVVNQLDSLLTGNDAVLLYNTQTQDTLDIFGSIGQNPGSGGWNVGAGSTVNHTLVRKDYVNQGELVWAQAAGQWLVYSQDFIDSLGTHEMYPCNPPNQCPELFISEYLEGSNQNRAVEIYNPSSTPVVLNGNYSIRVYTDGSTNFFETGLNGVIYPNDVFVLSNGFASLAGINNNSDQSESFPNLAISLASGNDAVALFKGFDTLDVIGVIGQNPGNSWTVLGTNGVNGSTENYTLVRDSSVQGGETNWTLGAGQWEVYAQDEDSYMGSHYMRSCPAALSKTADEAVLDIDAAELESPLFRIYPNPNSGTFFLKAALANQEQVHIQVRDLSGKQVYSVYDKQEGAALLQHTIRVGKVPAGMYIVTVRNTKSTLSAKVVIQH